MSKPQRKSIPDNVHEFHADAVRMLELMLDPTHTVERYDRVLPGAGRTFHVIVEDISVGELIQGSYHTKLMAHVETLAKLLAIAQVRGFARSHLPVPENIAELFPTMKEVMGIGAGWWEAQSGVTLTLVRAYRGDTHQFVMRISAEVL